MLGTKFFLHFKQLSLGHTYAQKKILYIVKQPNGHLWLGELNLFWIFKFQWCGWYDNCMFPSSCQFYGRSLLFDFEHAIFAKWWFESRNNVIWGKDNWWWWIRVWWRVLNGMILSFKKLTKISILSKLTFCILMFHWFFHRVF